MMMMMMMMIRIEMNFFFFLIEINTVWRGIFVVVYIVNWPLIVLCEIESLLFRKKEGMKLW